MADVTPEIPGKKDVFEIRSDREIEIPAHDKLELSKYALGEKADLHHQNKFSDLKFGHSLLAAPQQYIALEFEKFKKQQGDKKTQAIAKAEKDKKLALAVPNLDDKAIADIIMGYETALNQAEVQYEESIKNYFPFPQFMKDIKRCPITINGILLNQGKSIDERFPDDYAKVLTSFGVEDPIKGPKLFGMHQGLVADYERFINENYSFTNEKGETLKGVFAGSKPLKPDGAVFKEDDTTFSYSVEGNVISFEIIEKQYMLLVPTAEGGSKILLLDQNNKMVPMDEGLVLKPAVVDENGRVIEEEEVATGPEDYIKKKGFKPLNIVTCKCSVDFSQDPPEEMYRLEVESHHTGLRYTGPQQDPDVRMQLQNVTSPLEQFEAITQEKTKKVTVKSKTGKAIKPKDFAKWIQAGLAPVKAGIERIEQAEAAEAAQAAGATPITSKGAGGISGFFSSLFSKVEEPKLPDTFHQGITIIQEPTSASPETDLVMEIEGRNPDGSARKDTLVGKIVDGEVEYKLPPDASDKAIFMELAIAEPKPFEVDAYLTENSPEKDKIALLKMFQAIKLAGLSETDNPDKGVTLMDSDLEILRYDPKYGLFFQQIEEMNKAEFKKFMSEHGNPPLEKTLDVAMKKNPAFALQPMLAEFEKTEMSAEEMNQSAHTMPEKDQTKPSKATVALRFGPQKSPDPFPPATPDKTPPASPRSSTSRFRRPSQGGDSNDSN